MKDGCHVLRTEPNAPAMMHVPHVRAADGEVEVGLGRELIAHARGVAGELGCVLPQDIW